MYDWIAKRNPSDLQWSAGLLLTSVIVFALSADREFLLIVTLLGIALIGAFNSLIFWTPVALPAVIFCAILGLFLIVRRAKREYRDRDRHDVT